MGRTAILAGAFLGFLGVALGAFGAHALKPYLVEHNRLDTFELAVRYQFYHALALLATGILQRLASPGKLQYSVTFFLTGIIFFSGSLYALCFTSLGVIGLLTPLGGFLLILGWSFMVAAFLKKESP